MAESHSEGVKVGKFCSLRKSTCPCGTRYRKVCRPAWAKFTYPQLKQLKKGPKAFQMSYEAHHILCVASVTGLLSRRESIKKSLEQATWCINKGRNMIALPLFAHTVNWYSYSPRHQVLAIKEQPPFQDLPNHDYDHSLYQRELEADLNNLANSVEEAGHAFKPSNLVESLNRLSAKYKAELRRRGARLSGTHACWQEGMRDPEGLWYVPFSMAPDGNITDKSFPVRRWDDSVAERLDKLTNAFWGAA